MKTPPVPTQQGQGHCAQSRECPRLSCLRLSSPMHRAGRAPGHGHSRSLHARTLSSPNAGQGSAAIASLPSPLLVWQRWLEGQEHLPRDAVLAQTEGAELLTGSPPTGAAVRRAAVPPGCHMPGAGACVLKNTSSFCLSG